MKRKVLIIGLGVLGLGLIVFAVLVWSGALKQKAAGILVETEPASDVYINEVLVGRTPYEANSEPGEILIRLVPGNINSQTIDDYEAKVNLEPGVKTIVKRSFNIDENQTNGAIVSFEKVGGEESLITIVSIPDHAQVFIDGKAFGFTPLRTKVPPGDHQLLVSYQGYLDKSLPIRIYKGYKLTAIIKLAKNNVPEPTPEPVMPEDEGDSQKIKILDTGVGFLRVRSEPDAGSEVVGQVTPGEIYDVLETNVESTWYKIKVVLDTHGGESGEIEGWVSGEFVEVVIP